MAIKARPPYYPANDAVAVTPNDSTLITGSAETGAALYVGTTGNVVVDMEEAGSAITFLNVPGGTILPIRAIRVKAATTALNIVALW